MAKFKKTYSARTVRKRKGGYRKGYGKRKNLFKKKYGRRSKYPQETNKAVRHTHTMVCETTCVNAGQAMSFHANHVDANLLPAWQALAGMLHLSSKHYQLELAPLILDLSFPNANAGIGATFFSRIQDTIRNKHTIVAHSLSGVNVPAAQPIISWTGIKLKVIKQIDGMTHYIPCLGLQLTPDGGAQYITFVNGKLYVKCPKYVIRGQYSEIKGQWPTQFIIGNCTHLKIKVYYKILKKLEIDSSVQDNVYPREMLQGHRGDENHAPTVFNQTATINQNQVTGFTTVVPV